ncbi:ATP-binding protein [Massilia sp. YIM B04103]|uniref:ATP-binding protein n=1 Tax=Massilia sp. YIM B04103 TaxID=2963106 RepID=UPI00210D5BAE|nr:ATP-binding protein [Massilia sp. YIM B04103]
MMESETLAAVFGGANDEAAPLLPPQAKTVRDTGLEQPMLVELLGKTLFIAGRSPLPALATRLRLSLNVLRELLDFLVAEQLAEVAWRGDSDIDVQYQLTGAGRQRAAAWLERCRYAGPAPVTLEAYCAVLQRQAGLLAAITSDDMADVFAGDCLPASVHALAGAALHSGRSIFLYGPPGSGKSTLARKLGGLLQGVVAVPYALALGQEIVQIYDPLLHLPPAGAAGRQPLERRHGDSRWVLCRRPVVQAGAELAADMLDLRYDAYSGCYQAPPHLKANNGLFIIDDLGRQRVRPADLLNRFAQPLDARRDQLTLQGGHQFSLPFDAVLVFATSLAPHVLLDSAALRRVAYKIAVGAIGEEAYRALFRQHCAAADIAPDEAMLGYLIAELHGASGEPLLACYPREVVSRLVDFAGFTGATPRLTRAALEQAWSSMFAAVDEDSAAAALSSGPALHNCEAADASLYESIK